MLRNSDFNIISPKDGYHVETMHVPNGYKIYTADAVNRAESGIYEVILMDS